ncbi:hypothetical protein KsCSTR_03110 [Candidatus Kuenenia stuttgartiensis]|uniref:Uncharacterized protein n=1 Tax=Kuenenia stuttgartiensis TaxID=174633 RepID=Q1PY12_KUEST|nr:hypothetical protein KsCSTR_03110 [Candidatus Kuenenia stuttgartiensis]CAJ72920.1 unknown protein [Candidatus Kuenenia stuttgartiensis]
MQASPRLLYRPHSRFFVQLLSVNITRLQAGSGYKSEPANVVSIAITFPNRYFTMFRTRFENELCFGSLIDYAE